MTMVVAKLIASQQTPQLYAKVNCWDNGIKLSVVDVERSDPAKDGEFLGLSEVARYYEGRLIENGVTAQGVGWKDLDSQVIRFRQFDNLMRLKRIESVLDFGCGTGDYLTYLRESGYTGSYCGFDISEIMIETARQRYSGDVQSTFIDDGSALECATAVIGSGIFNVKGASSLETWRRYVEATLDRMWELTTDAMAFNVLSLVSDPDRRSANLYYSDPAEVLKYCMQTFSPHCYLSHRYGLFDFTVCIFRSPVLV